MPLILCASDDVIEAEFVCTRQNKRTTGVLPPTSRKEFSYCNTASLCFFTDLHYTSELSDCCWRAAPASAAVGSRALLAVLLLPLLL